MYSGCAWRDSAAALPEAAGRLQVTLNKACQAGLGGWFELHFRFAVANLDVGAEVDSEWFAGAEGAHLGTGLICRAGRDILKVKINPLKEDDNDHLYQKYPPPPHRGTFNHRLRHAGALLAVFTVSLLLISCPSPGGGGGTTTSNGGDTAIPDGGKPTPPAPEPEKPTPPTKPKAWHVTTLAGSDSNGGIDSTGTSASFTWPFSIAHSGATFYVTDRSWHSTRTIDTTTARVDTIVSNGGNGLMGGYAPGNGTTARELPRNLIPR